VLLKTIGVSLAVSLVAGLFCYMFHGGKSLAAKIFKNPFVRIFAGGCIVIVLTLIFGTDYNGGGMFVVERIFEEGTVSPEAFLLKIIFTLVTVSAGYKGGEIVPSFFIGATLGAV
jgi:H+/Cl- antiporter ClcA